MKELAILFTIFVRVGLFTFGGGYAMLPLMQKELCLKRSWATEEEIIYYYAVGQCTPGVMAVNVAAFIGHKRKGVSGACAAVLGLILPSLVIIPLIAALIKNFSELEVVRHAFAGIRVAVCALLIDAIIRFFKGGDNDAFGIALFGIALACSLFLNATPVVLVIASGIAGVIYKTVRRSRK